MDFLDEVVITARSGDGGKGCVSFRREKFIPRGGPDGGDGGDGGNIIARASERLYSLAYYRTRRYFSAPNGKPGRGKNQFGKNGADLILRIPLGTIIEDIDTGDVLGDLTQDGQELLILPGGKGGRGNKHFATSTNRAPKTAQPGLKGREKRLKFSLKFLADIGLIGLPNAGKSTLLSRLSMARPKVASYPFTTLTPNLGVITSDEGKSLVIADIPGLIQGASLGRGLGHRFLKHIERTSLLLHILDITYQPAEDILEDYHDLINEMEAYNPALTHKPRMVLVNKMDLYRPQHRDIHQLRKAIGEAGFASFPISALTGEGIEEVKEAIWEKWGDKERKKNEPDFEEGPLGRSKKSRGQNWQRRSHGEKRA